MHLVHDDAAKRGKQRRRVRQGQQHRQAFGCGQQDVRRCLPLPRKRAISNSLTGPSRNDGSVRSQNVHDVAVLDDIGLAFKPIYAVGFSLLHGTDTLEVVIANYFGTNEAVR